MRLEVDWAKFWKLPINPKYLKGYYNGFRRSGYTHGNKLYRDGYAEGLRDRDAMEKQLKQGAP